MQHIAGSVISHTRGIYLTKWQNIGIIWIVRRNIRNPPISRHHFRCRQSCPKKNPLRWHYSYRRSRLIYPWNQRAISSNRHSWSPLNSDNFWNKSNDITVFYNHDLGLTSNMDELLFAFFLPIAHKLLKYDHRTHGHASFFCIQHNNLIRILHIRMNPVESYNNLSHSFLCWIGPYRTGE